ncbi:MAG: P1 family peptidase [Steroidobacteraceae bacterium]
MLGSRTPVLTALLLAGLGASLPHAARADQGALPMSLNAGERLLQFDWPQLRIGTGEYQDGPTGVTVFHFPQRALAAVDVRGGGPGTVNTDYLRLGYDTPELDTVVFSGGSWYGLENVTATATALKDDGVRSGNWDNIALAVGAIIYDLGDRRLNEIYPDKPLAQAALRAARPGSFPLGAHGAGRFARTGGLFGCNAYSGQGGAFRQIGELKIAAFVVVNALGVVTTRDGRVAACYPDAAWPPGLHTTQLLAAMPASRRPGATLAPVEAGRRNTTISLVVTNRKHSPAELQRLATHVHSSMSRAIQPFATEFDGDVLYAVTTGELDAGPPASALPAVDLDVLAAELMWDAVLASVPPQPPVAAPPATAAPAATAAAALARHAGEYRFSPQVSVSVSASGGRLYARASGQRNAYAIGKDAPVELLPLGGAAFTVPWRYPLVLDFSTPGRLVINPGHWAQTGLRQ